jgi:hypothetical protein
MTRHLLKIWVPVLSAMYLFASPGLVRAAASEAVDWTHGVVTVVGEGVPPEQGSLAKRRLLAKRAAITDAYRKLAEVVNGVQVDARTVVKELELQSDEIRTSVSGLIKGAQIQAENITSDGAYEVRMVLPLFGQSGLASAVLGSSLNTQRQMITSLGPLVPEKPAQPNTPALTTEATTTTGLIVDARHLKASAALMPALLDEGGQVLYVGNLPVSEDELVAQGPVSYVHSMTEAQASSRAGKSPMVVVAKRYSGPFHADLVLSNDDSLRVKSLSTSGDVLKRLAVVIAY